ncbi:hypothetical protein DPMN_094511 [Dreissena polymorpha]|uniref:Uncharacterized protein n=1 Tax=Dreissena polymorpha TaxID=45954 RepID=A0A9D4L696_DREPO|nr:hypothetical protein DPMN_094511 [Dreissena polymorpha]
MDSISTDWDVRMLKMLQSVLNMLYGQYQHRLGCQKAEDAAVCVDHAVWTVSAQMEYRYSMEGGSMDCAPGINGNKFANWGLGCLDH